jgi:hypothetical protein
VTDSYLPPPEFKLEFDLGSIRNSHLPGTRPLMIREGPTFSVGGEDSPAPAGAPVIGYVETAPLPLFEPLTLAIHPQTREQILVSGAFDRLAQAVEPLEHLGFIEPYPISPREQPDCLRLPPGVIGLVRAIDRAAGRHRYAAGSEPEGELVVELGALSPQPPAGWPGAVPLWITPDGRVRTDRYQPPTIRASTKAVARWAFAPIAWRDQGRPLARARAAVRRAGGVRNLRGRDKASATTAELQPAGWLLADEGPMRKPLYSAVHPVTGDQLLTRYEQEAGDLGYVGITQLGFVLTYPTVTESLDMQRTHIPWASRFGRDARWQ